MTVLNVTEAKRYHCGQIIRLMRVDHQAALMRMNVPLHQEFRRIFDGSYYRRAAFLDGRFAALWGVEGDALSATGMVWLILAQHAILHPRIILRQARAEMAAISVLKRELETTVVWEDLAAQRFAIALGFQPADGSWPRASTGAARRSMMRYIQRAPDLIAPTGNGYSQIAIVYRGDARG